MKKLMIAALALTMVLGLAAVAAADSVTVGGSLRTEFSYAWYNAKEVTYGKDTLDQSIFDTLNSRVHVTYLSDDKKFKGYAELEMNSVHYQNNRIRTRHAYFSYAWGGGSILFGQTSSLVDNFGPDQWLHENNSLIGYGWSYVGRVEQIRLTLGDKYSFRFSLEAPAKTASLAYYDVNGKQLGTVKPYRYLPAVLAGFNLNFGNVTVYPYARWEWSRYDFPDKTRNMHSADLGLRINGDFGLVGFTVGVGYGINTATVNPQGTYPFTTTWTYSIWSGDSQAKHKQLQAFGELRIGGLAIGGGYAKANYDKLAGVKVWAEDPYSAAVYANYRIPFGKIKFIPEILWEKQGKDYKGVDKGDVVRVGLVAMLNF